jgi:UPF0271 protein
MASVDLNADLGESDELTDDERALLAVVTSASISCGAHAGTVRGIRATVEAAARAGVVIGAHPSYPDRPGRGRRSIELPGQALADSLATQIAMLVALADEFGAAVRYVKPHGALYNRLTVDEALGAVVAEAVRSAGDLVLLLQAGAAGLRAAERIGVACAAEAFADRAYRADGTLVARSERGAVLTDEDDVVAQARSIVLHHRAPVAGGGSVSVRASSLCVHGDTPHATELAREVRRDLEGAGVDVVPFVR